MLENASILLPVFVCLFWVALFLINWKRNSRPQHIWTVFLWLMGICSLVWGVLFSGVDDYSLYYKLDITEAFFSLSLFPLVYLYFWSLTHNGPLQWKHYLCFLPALLIGGLTTVFYGLMGEEQSADFVRHMIESRETYAFTPGTLPWLLSWLGWKLFYLIILIQVVVIMAYSTLNVIRYRRGLEHYFSNLDQKAIENNRAVLIGLYLLLFLSLLVYASSLLSPEKYFSIKDLFMAGTGITLYYMSFYDYINGKRLDHAKALITRNPQYTRDEIAHASGFLHAQNFSRVFKQQTGLTFSEWRKNMVSN